MKLLIALVLSFSLTGCASMHYKEWKPGQRIGFTFVSQDGCSDKFYIGNKFAYSKCF